MDHLPMQKRKEKTLESFQETDTVRTLGVDIGICIKDGDKKVLHQNALCKQICGNQEGTICSKGCMDQFLISENCTAFTEGMRPLSNKSVDGQRMDAVVINDGFNMTTLLYPLEDKHDAQMSYLKGKGLTARELEIMSFIIKGATNSEIAEKLFISRATLKTHLNNVYKKLPKDMRHEFFRG
jgi:ATP/maltotriose-dependent transcriptional regulator MalT